MWNISQRNKNEGDTKNETTIRRSVKTDLSTSKENVLSKVNRQTRENGIIEQLHKEILANDWSKYFNTIEGEER
ncbi:hypothetical protein [Bacillus sp. NTK034]|uniref:hypothetical protein n=1 Tax=Bacillus sp. NTK034 TaxID=2802176 RepID=UPI001A8DABC3|nr:hypothetical protein [Bacillus sp. NTK034]MBN8200520.1 hypothetical protein [Bacillus sp. NTK034]